MNDYKDIDRFMQNHINVKFPLNRPFYQYFFLEKFRDNHSLFIWKQHHSFCDGASSMAFILATSDNYDQSAMFPIKRIPFAQKLALRLSVPFLMIKALSKFMLNRVQKNIWHDGKRELSGNKIVSSSQDFLISDVKRAAKKKGVTINDMITACLSASVKQFFEMKGDTHTKEISIVIPANIRFKPYACLNEVKLENKFAAVPLRIPLCNDLDEAL